MFIQINVKGKSETINLNSVISFTPYTNATKCLLDLVFEECVFYQIHFTNPYALNETYKRINSSILNNKTLITLDSSDGVTGFELIIK